MSTEADLATAATGRSLVPGDPGRVNDVAGLLQSYGADLADAARGFASLTPANWTGQAAERFRDRFAPEPGRWQAAADAFSQAAQALSVYATSLLLAQDDAADALTRYRRGLDAGPTSPFLPTTGVLLPAAGAADDPGVADRRLAVIALEDARGRVQTAGVNAYIAVQTATSAAPSQPWWWQRLATETVAFGVAATTVAYNTVVVPTVNGVASFGAAMAQNPGLTATLVGGLLLTGVSAAGDGAGAVLSATGVGAVGGVPLVIASSAGVALGAGLVATSGAALGYQASQQNIQIVHRIGGEGKPRPNLQPTTGPRPPGVGDDWLVGPARDGKGIVWQRPGAIGDQDQIRIKDPDPLNPHGSVRFYNEWGQAIDLNGKPTTDARTHIPISADGSYPLPKGWKP